MLIGGNQKLPANALQWNASWEISVVGIARKWLSRNDNLDIAGPTNYVAEMWVESGPGNGCTVFWRGHFQRPADAGPGQDAAATVALVKGVFDAGLAHFALINK